MTASTARLVDDTSTLELNADVLVLGGGPAAAWAAQAAASAGAKVILADKGYMSTSGCAAASGNGVLAVPPSEHPRVIAERSDVGRGLVDKLWLERMLECTWLSMPRIEEWGYAFPKLDGKSIRNSYYGPEYLRVLRRRLSKLGVQILDQSPALELLVTRDGSVAGARGIRRQAHTYYTVRAGAVVLATGGCAFLSKALGSNVNTGDAFLMAVEAGAELSGMEFSSQYAVSSALNATVTRGVPYAWATFYDANGRALGGLMDGGRGASWFLPKALLEGPVFAKLDKATPEVRAVIEKSHPIAFLPLRKAGIDPYTQLFPVTLVLEGTVRGAGGVRIVNDECGASIPGLYAAGDAATRELIAGAATGGGGPNAAWAISSGQWAGAGAARYARNLGPLANQRPVERSGTVGLAGREHETGTFDADAIIRGVQAELFPLEKNYFRTEAGLIRSLRELDSAWSELKREPVAGNVREIERSRTAAALAATARWSYRSGLRRRETRSLNRRVDYPDIDPQQQHYQATGGLDAIWIRDEAVRGSAAPSAAIGGRRPQPKEAR
jgi:succinate dehydrogenase/fumarate reductase flavoprotein subunit